MRERFTWAVGCLGAAILADLLWVCGCWLPPPPSPSGDPEWLIQVGEAGTLTGAELLAAHNQLVAEQLDANTVSAGLSDSYDDWMNWLRALAPFLVDSRKITYWARDGNDHRIRLTGMLYLPKLGGFTGRPHPVPLIAYPHGTKLRKSQVPSNNDGDEWIFGAAAALVGGFAVAMPDLPGMGGADPNAYHPYCHAKSLAYSVVDMIRAVNEAFERNLRADYRWDGHLYVLGYSEGGYAAMATVKELQLNAPNYPGLNLTGSACLAGPYDLTGAMRRAMVDPKTHYSQPVFLPYLILGYNAIYGGLFNPNLAMNPVLLPDITQWMNGSMTGKQVNPLIEQRMGVAKGQVVPRYMLNAQWVSEQIDDDVYQTSEVGRILAANNLWSGWYPTQPMLMLHSPDDDYVPYANSLTTWYEFKMAGAGNWLEFQGIGKKGDGITHVVGGIIGLPTAFLWIKDVCPKN